MLGNIGVKDHAVPSWRHDEGVSQQRTQTSRPVQYSNGELCSKGTLLGAAFVHAVGVAAKGSGGLSVRLARVMGAGRGQSAAAGMRHDGVLVDLPGQAEGSVETVRPESCHRGTSYFLRVGGGLQDVFRGWVEGVGGEVFVAGNADRDLLQGP